MAWELADNIRGPKGDKGDPGTIAAAVAATLPPGAPAEVIMHGTKDVTLEFKIPAGDRGEQGVPGTISSASAESVAPDASAEVIMSGTVEVKHAHFRVPRGLPGQNAVPSDEATATYAATEGTALRGTLDSNYGRKTVVDALSSTVGPGGRLSDAELTAKTQNQIAAATDYAAAAAIIANYSGVNARG